MTKLKKYLIIGLSLVALLMLIVLAYFVLAFGYGGLEGFIAELRKQPSNAKLEKLRTEAISELTQVQEELGTLPELVLYDQTSSDMCVKGDHGWKRNDPYSHICVYRSTFYYGVDVDALNYRDMLLALEEKLSDMGWVITATSPEQPTIREVLSQYPGSPSLSLLPEYRNTRKVGNVDLNINKFKGIYRGYDWTADQKEPYSFGFGVAEYQIFHKQHNNQSPQEISERIISQNRQPLMLAVSKEYFSD